MPSTVVPRCVSSRLFTLAMQSNIFSLFSSSPSHPLLQFSLNNLVNSWISYFQIGFVKCLIVMVRIVIQYTLCFFGTEKCHFFRFTIREATQKYNPAPKHKKAIPNTIRFHFRHDFFLYIIRILNYVWRIFSHPLRVNKYKNWFTLSNMSSRIVIKSLSFLVGKNGF